MIYRGNTGNIVIIRQHLLNIFGKELTMESTINRPGTLTLSISLRSMVGVTYNISIYFYKRLY